jgi:hypothetical protein
MFQPVFGYSTNGGHQHWWTPNLRSTIAAGVAHRNMSSRLIGRTQASSTRSDVEALAFITTSVRYMYGKRIVVSNGTGQEQALIGKFRVAF